MMNINDTTTSSMSHTNIPSKSPSDQTQKEQEPNNKKVVRTFLEKNQEEEERVVMESGREKLKKHRREIAGRVWIPEIWGQEELLKDWIDCSTFDTCLVPNGISSARAALVEEARRAASASGGLHNRCLIRS
ncbi:unnamed protein product [Cochlearia groenlandica]